MTQEKMVSILLDKKKKFEAIWEPCTKYTHTPLMSTG